MSSSMTEIEFKFDIPRASLPAIEAALRGPQSRRTHLQARYFDTAQGDLAAQGVALRLRKEGPRWVQTAKALGDGPVQRLEHNVDLGPERKSTVLLADPARHADTPVGKRLAQVLRRAGAPLVEVYGTDIWRCTQELRVSSSRIELALDQGRVLAPAPDGAAPHSAVVCELELELLEGDVRDLARVAAEWAVQHRLTLSTVTKSERGLRLAQGQSTRPATKASAPQWPAGPGFPDGGTVQRAVVGACLAQILPNASEIAAGSEDAEQIHQLRVGLRRLRTALRELAPLGPGLDPAWEQVLAQAFRALGARRDRQQLLALVQPRLQAAGAPPIVLPPAAGTAPAPAEAVRDPAFQAALVALVGFAAAPAAGGTTPQATRRHLRKRLDKLHRRLLDEGARFDTLAPEARHALRKRLKRLRYLAEFVGACFAPRRAAQFTRALEPAQDALGSYYDEVVALQSYRAAVDQEPRAWFAVGWLLARAPHAAHQGQLALQALADEARPFWRKK
ncbi:CYTH and CHAD domain-containing protein [Pseudorhodoferax sp.]|uniref:CYTH and CHAD domain-containing protein n=1 Tax=Pseudorhodoferax sp. TaxID=1993553 RepID=UPI002DD64D11|nr:CHAD domain-containing protein [Pseudorhodoferax sp.]